jgi:hypothetical protein
MRPLPWRRAGVGAGGGVAGIMATLENGYDDVVGAAVAIERAHCRRGWSVMSGGGTK